MKIIVAGDSWAKGEWDKNSRTNENNVVAHGGLQQYLTEDGHEVIDASLGGQSNLAILSLIRQKLDANENIDYIFMFQTDPMREIIVQNFSDINSNKYGGRTESFNLWKKIGSLIENNIPIKPITSSIGSRPDSQEIWKTVGFNIDSKHYIDLKSYTDVIDKNQYFLEQAYIAAQQIAETFDKKIYLIGGLGKLNLRLLEKYDRLVPVVESLLEYFYPNLDAPELTSLNSYWRQILLDRVDFNKESIDYFYRQYELDLLMQSQMCREYFWPDGTHPNRKAHKILYEKLIKKITKL